MRAIVQRKYGDAGALTLEQVDRPVIGPDDVLVRVSAAGLNHADWVYTSGTPLIARLAFGLTKPKTTVRGKDVAGTVEAIGANVTTFQLGDDVYGELESGTLAEYVAAPVSRIALKPANLTFEQAATVPVSGMTALLGLRDAGRVRAGQRLLINGASGGVGTFAVQIGKALGAEVTAVCSARNADLAISLGADSVIDYRREDFTLGASNYDVIFDLIGNHTIGALRRVLVPTGTLVLSSGTGGRVFGPMGRILGSVLLAPFVGQQLTLVSGKRSSGTLDELRALIEAGHVTPSIDRNYSLAETPEAMRYFVDEHARGKIAITVSGSE
jgi:NADPH:quinone reductase-like Zn-dependent oxidoreductase